MNKYKRILFKKKDKHIIPTLLFKSKIIFNLESTTLVRECFLLAIPSSAHSTTKSNHKSIELTIVWTWLSTTCWSYFNYNCSNINFHYFIFYLVHIMTLRIWCVKSLPIVLWTLILWKIVVFIFTFDHMESHYNVAIKKKWFVHAINTIKILNISISFLKSHIEQIL